MPILGSAPLQAMHWPTLDPFLFCAHHKDEYPAGDERMAPKASLAGRDIGSDFSNRDGWSMYHGDVAPGFPSHPHRGFETVTLARSGYVDHSDSLGAKARFGKGDVQWMTAGKGIVHAEMFPLVNREEGNPTELFQIWLNLPAADKMVEPHFAMLWGERIPRHELRDAQGKLTTLVTIAGAWDGQVPPSPPPRSWAAQARSHLWIWTLAQEAGAKFTIPAADAGALRALYVFGEKGGSVDGVRFAGPHVVQVRADAPVEVAATEGPTEVLMLQGVPLREPVARHGPFVMNSSAQIQAAYDDYRRTRFGGWPWKSSDPTHPRDEGRFAVHADGKSERPIS